MGDEKLVRLVVVLNGGDIVWVGNDSGQPIEVAVIDYDTEGADPGELVAIPQEGNQTASALTTTMDACSSPTWVGRVFHAMKNSIPAPQVSVKFH